MTSDAQSRVGIGIRDLPPNIFAVVMATGIVSLALDGFNHIMLARILFNLNVVCYATLTFLLLIRILRFRTALATDLANHAKAPGFFTLVAAPCVLGSQCILMYGAYGTGLSLWIVGFAMWFVLSYAMLPCLIEGKTKPIPEAGINGTWLLIVVGTQAISVLASRLVPGLASNTVDVVLFVAMMFWLVGSMLYLWLISLIFHRIVFLPLAPDDLAPPYWINMGAMAISTLAGVCLIGEADRTPLMTELIPFVKGMTLLFWATATWWIPVLLALGAWRHLRMRVPLTYEHGYWGAVFPLGMYTVCTQALSRTFQIPFLEPIASVFEWIAITAWTMTFAGLVRHVVRATRLNLSISGKSEQGVQTGSGRFTE